METIYLKIEMPKYLPEGYDIVDLIKRSTILEDVTEINIPSDGKISLQADKYYMSIPKDHPKRGCDIAFLRGASWMLRQLTGQGVMINR